METPLTVGVREAARLLGVGRVAMYEAIRVGKVRVMRIGRELRVSRVELEDLACNPERLSRGSENG